VKVQFHTFSISALDECEWLASRPDCFTPRKSHRFPLNRRLGGPRSQSGHFWGRYKSLAPVGIRTPDRPASSLVTKPTMIYQLVPKMFQNPKTVQKKDPSQFCHTANEYYICHTSNIHHNMNQETNYTTLSHRSLLNSHQEKPYLHFN